MPWGYAAAAVGSYVANSNKGSPTGQGTAQYVPTDQAGVDTTWQGLFNQNAGLAGQSNAMTNADFTTSLANQNAINYQPYLNAANNAGNAYNTAANMGAGQAVGYQGMANTAQQAQGALYNYGQGVMNTAMDPQNALYNATAQQTQDQIRAGQAARGLGNSPEGSMEEADAMGNFNMNWQNQQLSRQVQGAQAASSLSGAGVQQGQLYGADQSAALGAQGAAAGYYGQAGQVPLSAAQYAAAAPGQAAQTYNSQIAGLQANYGTAMNGAQSYMGLGNSAQMGNYNANTAANAQQSQFLNQFGQAMAPTINGWFGNNNNTTANQSGIVNTGSSGPAYDSGSMFNDLGYG